jgi:5,10-methylenetetrahydromethanopterin reductase
MEISISIMPSGNLPEIGLIAQVAENIGYTKCWINDEGLVANDPYVTLAAIALNTRRIKLGVGFTNPYTRHPGITASSTLTLNALSNGRAFLGVTAGGTLTLGPLGISQDKPTTHVRNLINACRALFNGSHYDFISNTIGDDKGSLISNGKEIEIWVAARSPRLLKVAGELADGIVLGPVCKNFLEKYVGYIHEGALITGNHPKIAYSAEIITSDQELQELRRKMGSNVVDSSNEVKEMLGITQDEEEILRREIRRGNLIGASKLVKDEWIRQFVIMGSETECQSEIRLITKKFNISEFQVRLSWSRNPYQQITKLYDLLNNI